MKTRYRTLVAALVALCVIGVCLLFVMYRSSRLYRTTILPSLGGDFTMADAINDRGQIVGTSSVLGGAHHLFLWDRNEGMQDLGPVNGPADINNEGQICATAMDPNGQRGAFILDPDGTRRWLGTLGGGTSIAMAINNRGQVVGESWTAEKSWTGLNVSHAFLWDEMDGMQDLHPPGADQSYALAINDHGQALVYWPQQKVFIWDPNQVLLPTDGRGLGTFFGFGEINNKGEVAITSRSPRHRSRLLVSNGAATWRTLLELNGDVGQVWRNEAGQVLLTKGPRQARIPLPGRLFAPRRSRSYVWDPDIEGLVCLDDHMPRGNDRSLAVRNMNNKGCVVGCLFSPTSNRRQAILLEPVPECWGR